MTLAIADTSSGAASAAAMNPATVAGVAGRTSMPPTTDGTSCSWNRNRVTTPKLPPPPRIAQKRSGSVSASMRRIRPSAVTISAASRESRVRPNLRPRYPTPPPRVIPDTPTDPVSPNPTARPCSAAAVVNAAAEIPAPAHAV